MTFLGAYSAMNSNICRVLCNYHHNHYTEQFCHTPHKSLMLPVCGHTYPLPQLPATTDRSVFCLQYRKFVPLWLKWRLVIRLILMKDTLRSFECPKCFCPIWRFCGDQKGTYTVIWNCTSDGRVQVPPGAVPDKQSSMTGRNSKNAGVFREVGHGLESTFVRESFSSSL